MVGYPTPKRIAVADTKKADTTHYGKRGMSLEDDINATNAYYLDLQRAVIHKKPTPIQIVSVDYASRSTARITEAYFRKPSTTDYNGVYRGKAIDFEAKEIASLTAFPLKMLHKHQLTHLENVLRQGCIAFILIRFSSYQETYFVKARDLLDLSTGERRSVPYVWFKTNAYLIPYSLTPPVNYLGIVDNLYFKGEPHEKI
ncbi:MAG: Holliday junction resolvase RecU [Erysipelotrichaceae bacterium]|nr:Holliday junction resolvase RecU [Erysipelotrichaceae bacterium]